MGPRLRVGGAPLQLLSARSGALPPEAPPPLSGHSLPFLVVGRMVNSPFGMALRATRENETRAEFIGIHVRRFRWYPFIISGIFTGVAGGLLGQ